MRIIVGTMQLLVYFLPIIIMMIYEYDGEVTIDMYFICLWTVVNAFLTFGYWIITKNYLISVLIKKDEIVFINFFFQKYEFMVKDVLALYEYDNLCVFHMKKGRDYGVYKYNGDSLSTKFLPMVLIDDKERIGLLLNDFSFLKTGRREGSYNLFSGKWCPFDPYY